MPQHTCFDNQNFNYIAVLLLFLDRKRNYFKPEKQENMGLGVIFCLYFKGIYRLKKKSTLSAQKNNNNSKKMKGFSVAVINFQSFIF